MSEKSINARIKWLLIAGGVFVAVAACLLVWIPYQRQMRLIEEIEAMPGGVVRTEEVGPEWLRILFSDERMRGFDSIVEVRLADFPIDDACLERLGHLAKLRELSLGYTHFSDDGLKHLAGLKSLERLDLNDTPIRHSFFLPVSVCDPTGAAAAGRAGRWRRTAPRSRRPPRRPRGSR